MTDNMSGASLPGEEEADASLRGDDAEDSFVDGILDDLLPEDLDWRMQVRRYPISALVISGLAGFFLGSRHGAEIVSAMSGFASREVDRNISNFLGDDAARPRG